jgi:transposase
MGQTEQAQAARDGAVVFVAMELSKTTWLLAAQASPSGKTSSHKLDGGDILGLLALLRRLQAREQRASGHEVRVVVGYEAGYDGFWLQRRLAAEEITCWVMDPGSLQVDRRARRAKTDRLDAAMLLRTLMAWCRGDRTVCHMVQVPSVEREDARRTHRERQRLIAERGQHVNRIKGGVAGRFRRSAGPLERPRRAACDAGHLHVPAAASRPVGASRGAAHRRRPPTACPVAPGDRARVQTAGTRARADQGVRGRARCGRRGARAG